jgi:hypothetical protein
VPVLSKRPFAGVNPGNAISAVSWLVCFLSGS